MAIEIIKVPDIGGADSVDVIEVSVAVGDIIKAEDSILVLESDKASMDVPSPVAGKVVKILVKEGDKVSEGVAVLEVEIEGAAAAPTAAAAAPAAQPAAAPTQPAAAAAVSTLALVVPDIGGSEGVEVIEIAVAIGDEVKEGDSLIVLESDKASMEIPSPASGKILGLTIKVGDKVSEGAAIGQLQIQGAASASAAPAPAPAPVASAPAPAVQPAPAAVPAADAQEADEETVRGVSGDVYAGPAVRKLARQLGVALTQVPATGPRSRITKDDVRNHVKKIVESSGKSGTAAPVSGSGIPAIPAVDFAQFGEIELVKMSKIKKVTAANMTRNWLNVPHVTQFDSVDITELEAFRKTVKDEADKAGVKLTPVPFLLKACAAALKAEPAFNVSLHADGEHIVQKKYIHIGIAVDTPNGLVVPVIRNVDQKSLFDLAGEAAALAKKAREGKLLPKDMQGGCFTISSLGAIGGTGFTPIVNAPEVSILGVSRADIQPVWNGKEFTPRLLLPLCLSYDHRAINGGDAGRFLTYLGVLLADVRRLLL